MEKRTWLLAVSLLLLSAITFASPDGDLPTVYKAGQRASVARKATEDAADYLGSALEFQARTIIGLSDDGLTSGQATELANVVSAAKIAHEQIKVKSQNPQTEAKQILQEHGYQDFQKLDQRNWAAKGMETLVRDIFEFISRLFPKPRLTGPQLPLLDGSLLTGVMWFVIASAVCGLIYFAVTQFNWKTHSRVKKAKGLAEDEPDRTADEWLDRADALAAKGLYREAVRSLYVASLVRIDEANIARFKKGETNWEHLHRIEASPRRPAELNFRPPTQRFDIVWYGHRDEGQVDFERFKAWYEETVRILGARP